MVNITMSTMRDISRGMGSIIDRGVLSFGLLGEAIPQGRCAVLRQVAFDATLFEDVKHLYSTWLPESGGDLSEEGLTSKEGDTPSAFSPGRRSL